MGLQIYNAQVRPHLERTYIIWCAAKQTDMLKVDRIHRSALLRITGAFVSTSTASMEVLTCTSPIRLRLECTLLQEHVRILTKPQGDHLRSLLMDLMRDEVFMDHRILTPLHMLKIALRGIPGGLPTPEETPKHSLDRLQATLPEVSAFDKGLGASGTRTAAMAAAARLKGRNLIESFKDGSPVIFVDGSALGNPGPTGAAAVCFPQGIKSEPVTVKEAVGKLSTSYHGEVYAIWLATEFLKCYTSGNNNPTDAHILADCQSAIISCNSRDTHKSHQECIDKIHKNVQELKSQYITTKLHWVAGHVELSGNELADQAAKQAALEADTIDLPYTTSKSTICGIIKRAARSKWQRAWNYGTTGRDLFEYCPKIPTKNYSQSGTRKDEIKLLRVRSGHTSLKSQLYHLKLNESPECDCGNGIQTIRHVIMQCPTLNTPRKDLFNSIDNVYQQHHTPIWERLLTLDDIIWPQHSETETRVAVTKALQVFLRHTNI